MRSMMATCRGSPTSQKICFRHVKAARNLSLAKVLEEDYRLLHHMCHISNDFVEGIRAKLIEKDNNARWRPATVDKVVAFLLQMLSGWTACSELNLSCIALTACMACFPAGYIIELRIINITM